MKLVVLTALLCLVMMTVAYGFPPGRHLSGGSSPSGLTIQLTIISTCNSTPACVPFPTCLTYTNGQLTNYVSGVC
jgi:hypothetical protein